MQWNRGGQAGRRVGGSARCRLSLAAAFAVPVFLSVPDGVSAQEAPPVRAEIEPSALSLNVGDTARVKVRLYDASGTALDLQVFLFSSNRRRLAVSRDGKVTALRGGEYVIRGRIRGGPPDLRIEVPVTVAFPPLKEIDITPGGERFFAGASVRHRAHVVDVTGAVRPDLKVRWTTSDPTIATVDRLGVFTAHRPGDVILRASAAGLTGEQRYNIVPSPVRTLVLEVSADSARTGDVMHAAAVALDGSGRRVDDAPISYTLLQYPDDSIVAQIPGAEIDQTGRFVAYEPGNYTIVAITAGLVSQRSVDITSRDVSQEVETVGHGAVRDVRTSDLWVWQGVDGRDYAATGTWSANGAAYFWDVTDPADPELIDSIVVDARTVNDVKVSEDGRVCVITREGASNRKNGLVILDCSDPHNVEILATFDDQLTGGVHNVFIYQNHIYAVNNGRKFDVINIEDPRNPRRVGSFELDAPGHGLHDVWVVDGIAYTSNWSEGVVLIDVGNGIAGGSPSHPVKIAQYRDYRGATHAAFPYRSSTGKFYVIMGDEIGASNNGPTVNGRDDPAAPERMAGYLHFVDFTDPQNPEEVARYEVPEAGSHNFWVEGDKLYTAFYNGGLRVVDISGELKGNLTYQNREIAKFMAYDPDGFTRNGVMTWGPQPYKGNIFIAEHFSGLWAVRLKPRAGATP